MERMTTRIYRQDIVFMILSGLDGRFLMAGFSFMICRLVRRHC
jgi:hypothetical protein